MDALLDMIQRGVASADGVPTTDKAKVVVFIDLDTLLGDLDDDIPEAFRRKRLAGTGPAQALACAGAAPEPAPASRCRATSCRPGSCGAWPAMPRSSRWCSAATADRSTWVAASACSPGRNDWPWECATRGAAGKAARSRRAGATPTTSRHWRHGGPTSLLNGALLCPKHHTEVHDRDLTATVTALGVTWHT